MASRQGKSSAHGPTCFSLLRFADEANQWLNATISTWFTDAFVWPPKIEQGHVLEAKRTASADVRQTQALNKELQG